MNPDTQKIWDLFTSLYPSPAEELASLQKVPFLAHYTSITALEGILRSNEIWFSNPLFMNDLEEVRFGIIRGTQVLRANEQLLTSLGTDERRARFISALDHSLGYFEENHAFDTYVFCLSKHDINDRDGRLSMWRGYGGQGRGAAIIFDTSKVTMLAGSPLILSKVHYGSGDERLAWVTQLGEDISKIVRNNSISNEQVYLIAQAAFERLKLFALFSKHIGFAEEEEWRVVYMPDRDEQNQLKQMLEYSIGSRGIEPKLKLKAQPLQGVIPDGVTLSNLTAEILLGPTTSSLLAQRSVARMLEVIGKPELKNRLRASSIPLRES
jgi:hypothetical protein